MRIGEIAEKTGLSISNIRFYEKKGLIGPDREKESKYRNYTDGDLDRIKRMEHMGFEPTTSTMRMWRAPNCANAP